MNERASLVLLFFAAVAMGSCNRVETQAAAPAVPTAPAPAIAQAAAPEGEAPLSLAIALDAKFSVARKEGRTVVLRIEGVPDVELLLVVGRDPISGPMPNKQELVDRALAFLEPVHGDLVVDATEGGDTLLRFAAEKKDGNRTLHTVNWMMIRPGDSDVLRADLTLRMPSHWAEQAQMKMIADHIDERLALASFQPDR